MAVTLTTNLRNEYQLLFDSCLIRPARLAAASTMAARVSANRNRYQTVGKPLGIPWYLVGLVHAMEASLNFSTHLHNGDPLSARTTHVPAGRPAAGHPPFTWEESATDALKLEGLGSWTDWSLPGLLFRLELYNGWGYRGQHPPVPTPYLWSFSNHYTKGKYVGDGTFSASAVSQQCGAAVILKRLVQIGAVQLGSIAPRALQLANPHMTGPDVVEAQRLLAKNPFGDFAPGTADGDYGSVSRDATKRAKWALGYPPGQVDGSFGPALAAYLSGKKPLPPAYKQLRAKRLAAAPGEAQIRQAIVKWALWGVAHTNLISYTNGGARLAALATPGALPLATDCSAFATLCYSWAKAPNPNVKGPYNAAAGGFTGTMLTHCKHIPRSAAKPGDLVVWTPPNEGHHVCVLVSGGADPWLVSHGDDSGPKKLRFSVEDAAQRQGGHGTVVYLSAF